jgi:membrane associated rhomboid family serine protease
MGLGDRDYYRPTGFGGFSILPPVIKKLLILNGIVFFLQVIIENMMFSGIPGHYYLNRYFALNPLIGLDQLGQTNNFQVWQLFTYQFLHGDIWHIGFNMFFLWMFGMEIENYWGSNKFLFFYLLSGIVGGLLQLLVTPFMAGAALPTIGASGAVYGVMVAFAMFFPDRYIYIYMLIPVKAKYLIVFLMVIEFSSVGNLDVVAHLVHIGGALAAFVFIMLDRQYNFNIDRLFSKFKPGSKFDKKDGFEFKNTFRRPFAKKDQDVEEAKFYEINSRSNQRDKVDQDEIDRILDKISQSGYQNLTDKEKRILFEASKKS